MNRNLSSDGGNLSAAEAGPVVDGHVLAGPDLLAEVQLTALQRLTDDIDRLRDAVMALPPGAERLRLIEAGEAMESHLIAASVASAALLPWVQFREPGEVVH